MNTVLAISLPGANQLIPFHVFQFSGLYVFGYHCMLKLSSNSTLQVSLALFILYVICYDEQEQLLILYVIYDEQEQLLILGARSAES